MVPVVPLKPELRLELQLSKYGKIGAIQSHNQCIQSP